MPGYAADVASEESASLGWCLVGSHLTEHEAQVSREERNLTDQAYETLQKGFKLILL